MKPIVWIFTLLATSSFAFAVPQHATAIWLMSGKKINPGEPIRTIIKMQVSDGWHTYWKNPGEGGIPLEIEATLPEGWIMGEIQYPKPKRYLTGELPSYGYAGEVIFPVTLTPPPNTDGLLPEIKASLSWLTCNESSCVPGEAELTLSSTGDATAIHAAYNAIPTPLPDVKLAFVANKKEVTLTLILTEKNQIDPSTYEFFPATPDIIDVKSELKFIADPEKPGIWTCTVKSSPYIPDTVETLSIELFKEGHASWSVTAEKSAPENKP